MVTIGDYHKCKYRRNNRDGTDRRISRDGITSMIIRLFNSWTLKLRLTPSYAFDYDSTKNHRCAMTLPLCPHLESIGSGAHTKKEAKANAIIAFLAHLERRKQVGLFVPYIEESLVQCTMIDVGRACVPLPDLNLNRKEYLLLERIISKDAKILAEKFNKIFEQICDVKLFMLRKSDEIIHVYFVGAKEQTDLVLLFGKILFDTNTEQYFEYGDQSNIFFSDDQFLIGFCRRCKILCLNQIEKRCLLIHGENDMVQSCLRELRLITEEHLLKSHSSTDNTNMKQTIVPIPRIEEPIVIEIDDDDIEIIPSEPTRKVILRSIVLDGQNIARNSNDCKGKFSWLRLSNAVDYFKKRGHEHLIAFLPNYCQHNLDRALSNDEMEKERKARDSLIQSGLITFTPSRYSDGKRITNYDDRFILQYAAQNDAVVVSNDNFRDLEHEETFRFIIRNRILPFATINHTFMPATDPLGRHGPNLESFLSKII